MFRVLRQLKLTPLSTILNKEIVPPTQLARQLRPICMSPVSLAQKKMISVTYINRDGVDVTVKAKVGDTLLDAAVNNDVDLEGFGACEGTLSCSTCHVILKKEDFDKLPDKPSDEELDMLDLAFGLSETSRLGCQITLTESMDGIVVQVPAQVADARNR